MPWVFLCVTASSVAAALRAAGSGLNSAPFVSGLGLSRPAPLQRRSVPVSRTHELLIHLAGCTFVRLKGGDAAVAGVGSVTSCVCHVGQFDE